MKQALALLTLIVAPAFANQQVLELDIRNGDLAEVEVLGRYYTGCSGKQIELILAQDAIEVVNSRQAHFASFLEILEKRLSTDAFAQVQHALRPARPFPGGMITCQAMVRDSGKLFINVRQMLNDAARPNVRLSGKFNVRLPEGTELGDVTYFKKQN